MLMWIKIDQELNPQLLITSLIQLKQQPQPIIFSFQNSNDLQITYLINTETFSSYDPQILTAAINIHMWQNQEQQNSSK